MIHNPASPHRRSIRLKGYDYSLLGAYFVMLAARGRECLFGEVEEGEIRLSQAGRVVADELRRLERHFPDLRLDAYVIMPNHIHAIIVIADPGVWATRYEPEVEMEGGDPGPAETMGGSAGSPIRVGEARPRGPVPGSLGAFTGQFKSRLTKCLCNPLGQRNYYEHIIRHEGEWERVRLYIQENPRWWEEDREYA